MARTRIQILAEQVGINAHWIKIDQDNVNQYLKQLDYKISVGELFSGETKIVRAPIIKGDGVNGELAGIYPGLDTADSYINLINKTRYNVAAGNLSEIFTYLNAGGPNVKYTRLIYSNISQIFSNDESKSDRFYRNPYNTIQHVMDIYWGKYIEFHFIAPVEETFATHHAFMEGERNFQVIEGLSGEIDISYMNFYSNPDTYLNEQFTSDPVIASINLDQKRITGIPANNSNHEGSYNSWVIETDDFATTVSAPTPQEDVSGTKISELSSTSSLQDDDLLIISRDEGSDGSFDVSYNVSLSNLAAKMINDMPANGWSSGWVTADDGETLNFNHNLGSTDLIFTALVADDQSGTNARRLGDFHEDDGSGGSSLGFGHEIKNITSITVTLQLGKNGYYQMDSNGVNASNAIGGNPVSFNSKYVKLIAVVSS